jgi:hypothetical protein
LSISGGCVTEISLFCKFPFLGFMIIYSNFWPWATHRHTIFVIKIYEYVLVGFFRYCRFVAICHWCFSLIGVVTLPYFGLFSATFNRYFMWNYCVIQMFHDHACWIIVFPWTFVLPFSTCISKLK